MQNDFEIIFLQLEKHHVRYLVVGGVAVVLHGYPRFTADLDLVLSMQRDNIERTILALKQLSYQSRAPVDAELFADPDKRQEWIQDKGLTVFSLWSPKFPATAIDLFVEEPFPFDEAYARATTVQLPSCKISVVSISDLIKLKKIAGRPKDLEDIEYLTKISTKNGGNHE